MLTLTFLLILAAFIMTFVSACGKCPLWIPVFLLVMLELLRVVPLK